MGELKDICLKLNISDKGKKGPIIARILYFVEIGKVIMEPKIPEISKAKRGHVYPLSPDGLILKGAYKNDLKTREFFKKLVGRHFHFTAFGIDWVNDRWLEGKPPTYQEFAAMWQTEYEKDKQAKRPPKEEWAYINFTQRFIVSHPDAPRAEIMGAWEMERQRQKEMVNKILQEIISV